MAHIHIDREVMFDSPTLVEGLPGVGLVGKITTDHLVDRAKEISDARQQLAQQMQEADERSTQAQPLGMYR